MALKQGLKKHNSDKGSSTNDITQVGERGCHFYDAMYKGMIKTAILVLQRRGCSKNLKICARLFLNGP